MSEQKRIGDLLVARGLLDRATADALAETQKAGGRRYASTAVAAGKVSEEDALAALAAQTGTPAIDLGKVVIAKAVVARVPQPVAEQSLMLPLRIEGQSLLVAVANPDDRQLLDEVGFVTGMFVQPYVALHAQLVELIPKAHAAAGDYRGARAEAAASATSPLPVVQAAAEPPGLPAALDIVVEVDDDLVPITDDAVELAPTEEPTAAPPVAPPPAGPAAEPARAAVARPPLPSAAPPPATPRPASTTLSGARPAMPSAVEAALAAADDAIPAPRKLPAMPPARPPPRPTPATPPAASAPVTAPSTPTSAASAPSATAGARKVVLVVEDDPEIQKLVVSTLASLGHEIVTASRGLEALGLIKERKPDLLVLDAMLPEVHGFEICRKVKESKRFGNTPVLMLSAIYRGWRIAEDIKATYKVDAFLEKPFRVGDLRQRAQQLIDNKPAAEEVLGVSARGHVERAEAALGQEALDAAFGELREAETLEPFSAKVQYLLGQVLEKRDRAFQAIYHYERAIELKPDMFAATKSLAALYQSKGFRNKAVEMWERSMRAAPSEEIRAEIKQHLMSLL